MAWEGGGFQGATIDRGLEGTKFDAAAYSFFDLPPEDDGEALGGALEDGLEAPPEEEQAWSPTGGDLDVALEPAEDEIVDYTVAGIFRPPGKDHDNGEERDPGDLDLDAALLEARSLPKDMLADDSPQRAPQPQRLPQPPPFQSQPIFQTPPPKQSVPKTLAEIEAEMAAATISSAQRHQPPPPPPPGPHGPFPMHSPQLMQSPDMRGQFMQGPGPGAPGMPPHMQPPVPPPPPPPHPFYGMQGPPRPPGMPPHMAGMQSPQLMARPMGPGMQPGGSPMPPPHMMHGMPSPVHNFPPGMPPGMRPMMPPMSPHMHPGPGMPPGMRPPMGAWQHGSPLHPPPHMMQQGMVAPHPGMGGPGGFMQSPGTPHMPRPHSLPPHHHTPPDIGMSPGAHMHPSPYSRGGESALSRPRYMGRYMTASDVEHIMQILYQAVHAGLPYHEDYYYQAYVNQVTNGRNAAAFKPEELRSLRPDVAKLDPSASVKFAAVTGLGKIVLTNIRTPKVLMDLTASDAQQDGADQQTNEQTPTAPLRPLEQEPLLAARIMIEDCHDKLLDVDDIDRCFTAAQQMQGGLPGDAEGLRARRALLATSVTAAFRLPSTPGGQADASNGDGLTGLASSDSMLLNIMTLPKGRSMLSRALRVLLGRPQQPVSASSPAAAAVASVSPEQLLWALMRNAWTVYGSSVSDMNLRGQQLMSMVEATHKLASAAREAIHHFTSAHQAVDAMESLAVCTQGRAAQQTNAQPMDKIMPLAQVKLLPGPLPDNTSQDWLGDIIVLLLQRGAQLLAEAEQAPPPAPAANGSGPRGGAHKTPAQLAARWRAGCDGVVTAFREHVQMLSFFFNELSASAKREGTVVAPESLSALRALACRPLAQQLFGIMGDSKHVDVLKSQLRQLL